MEQVSPQIYLQSLYGASCCALSETFLVVFDPKTDFTVTPWLEGKLGRGLLKGEVIGGSYIFEPPEGIRLYGYPVTLKGNLEPTGTGLDQTLFMTEETAQAMANSSLTTAEKPLVIPQGEISAIMVKVSPRAEAHRVALQILFDVDGVTPIESPNLFGAFRKQMLGLLWGFVTLLSMAWGLSAVLIGLISSMAVNERRREIAVLRALGATRNFVFFSVLTEALLLALCGGALGIILGSSAMYVFKDYIAGSLGMPLLFPALGDFVMLVMTGELLALVTVGLAAFSPAFGISRKEPALAMRE